MITTTHNNIQQLLTIHFTNEVGQEDIFSLIDSLTQYNQKDESLQVLIYTQCQKANINPAQIYHWANMHSKLLHELKKTKVAIISTRPIFVALGQIFRQQYNSTNLDIEVFSGEESALIFLEITRQ